MESVDIRRLRQRLGLTQRELGERLDVDQGTVSRWERGIESPRPSRQSQLRKLQSRNEDDRQFSRSLAFVANDLLPATLLDANLRLIEASESAKKFYAERGQDPAKLHGMALDSHINRLGVPEFTKFLKKSGLLKGDALFLRFVVNVSGKGHVTVWEPVFVEGELSGVLNYITRRFAFPANDEHSIELVEYAPAANPKCIVTVHRGKRADMIAELSR
jgi:transcriptional regulator with XRE-family HTH domain